MIFVGLVFMVLMLLNIGCGDWTKSMNLVLLDEVVTVVFGLR